MLDQDSTFYLISFSILITCLLNNVWMFKEKVHVNNIWVLKGCMHAFSSRNHGGREICVLGSKLRDLKIDPCHVIASCY